MSSPLAHFRRAVATLGPLFQLWARPVLNTAPIAPIVQPSSDVPPVPVVGLPAPPSPPAAGEAIDAASAEHAERPPPALLSEFAERGLQWIGGETSVRCPMCGDEFVKERLVRIASMADPRGEAGSQVDASRCSRCGTIVVEGCAPDCDEPNDNAVDRYIEQFCGVEPIFDQLAPFADAGIQRFADVGCNFGFGVDMATRLFGWDSAGFEPSYAAVRGSRQLTSRVRNEALLASTVVPGGRFDLILASEVLEHVDDPKGFIDGLMSHLAETGTLVLTTPSAQAVRRSLAPAFIVTALSPGYHRFLASKAALTELLIAAGLASVEITDDGRQLVAVARRRAPDWAVPPRRAGTDALLRYLDGLADAPDVSAQVRLAGACRHYKQLVLRGMFADAESSRMRLDSRLKDLLGWSLADRDIIRDRINAIEPLPSFVSTLMFAEGIRALLADDPRSAADQFALSVQARDKLSRDMLGNVDLETTEMSLMAAAHLVLAQARVEASAVVAALAALETRAAHCSPLQRRAIDRVVAASFTTLVNMGAYGVAAEVVPWIERTLESLLGGQPEERRAGLDALFCRAVLALHRGDPALAQTIFCRCCDETVDDGEPHAQHLFSVSTPHASGWVRPPNTGARGGAIYSLELYWADARGIYVGGFAFVPGHPATGMQLRWGTASVDAGAPTRHDGAARMYPGDPATERCGFRAHLLGPLTSQLTIELQTAAGTRRIELDLPPHPLPDWPVEGDPEIARRALVEIMQRTAPDGPIIALGTRGHTDEETAEWRETFSGREVIGVDIHPGPGVDVVADAHCLIEAIEPGSVAAFVSHAVFEHLEIPWLVAHQVQRILRVGGLAFVSAPMIWPEHAAPNDFWRVSPFGLRSLFGPALGFRVIASGGWGAVSTVPGPRVRDQLSGMPTIFGPSMAYVLARKETELPADVVRWPYAAAAGAERARLYPVDAVETGR